MRNVAGGDETALPFCPGYCPGSDARSVLTLPKHRLGIFFSPVMQAMTQVFENDINGGISVTLFTNSPPFPLPYL